MTNTTHAISKPTLFISHATTDGEFAKVVQQEIEKVFAGGLAIFSTASPGAVAPGTDWLATIETRLVGCQAIIVIVTPVSIERPWLWFELGATWANGRAGACRIYPLCAPEVDADDLPSPLDRLQALSLGKAADLKLFFETLIGQFGFGKIASLRASNISSRIPKYEDVTVKEVDLNDHALYSGKYLGYDDAELCEVIDAELLAVDRRKWDSPLPSSRDSTIKNGRLLHFRQVDRQLELPPGTARSLLTRVAERYALVPEIETRNIVKFRPHE